MTTSRKPSPRTRTFCKDFARVFPHSVYSSRGKASLDSVIEKARELGKEFIAIVFETNGNPSKIEFIKVSEDSWDWAKSLQLTGVSLSREISGKKIEIPTDLSISGKSKQLEEFLVEVFGLDYFIDESEFQIKLTNKPLQITFTYDGKEVGPTLNVKKVGE